MTLLTVYKSVERIQMTANIFSCFFSYEYEDWRTSFSPHQREGIKHSTYISQNEFVRYKTLIHKLTCGEVARRTRGGKWGRDARGLKILLLATGVQPLKASPCFAHPEKVQSTNQAENRTKDGERIIRQNMLTIRRIYCIPLPQSHWQPRHYRLSSFVAETVRPTPE